MIAKVPHEERKRVNMDITSKAQRTERKNGKTFRSWLLGSLTASEHLHTSHFDILDTFDITSMTRDANERCGDKEKRAREPRRSERKLRECEGSTSKEKTEENEAKTRRRDSDLFSFPFPAADPLVLFSRARVEHKVPLGG